MMNLKELRLGSHRGKRVDARLSRDSVLLRVQTFLLILLVGLIVADPTGGLFGAAPHMAVLGLLALVSLGIGLNDRFARLRRDYAALTLILFVVTFAVLIPIYGLSIYRLRGPLPGGEPTIFDGAYVHLVVITFSVTVGVGYRLLLRICTISITALAGLIWLIFLAGLAVGSRQMNTFGYSHHVFTFTHRIYAGVPTPYIYYYTAPLLVLAGAIWLHRAASQPRVLNRHLVPLGLVLSAMVLSGTRMNLILAGLLVVGIVWRVSRIAVAAILVVGVLAVALSFNQLKSLVPDNTSQLGSSDAARLSVLSAYRPVFSDPNRLTFGDGLGSCIRSRVRYRCMPVTEVTYIDNVRIFGLVGASLNFFLLLLPVLRLRRRAPGLWSGYLLYLGSAVTNPYIFSTLGLLVVSIAVMATYSTDDLSEDVARTERSGRPAGSRRGVRASASS